MSSYNCNVDLATLLIKQTRRQSPSYGSVNGRIQLLLERWALPGGFRQRLFQLPC